MPRRHATTEPSPIVIPIGKDGDFQIFYKDTTSGMWIELSGATFWWVKRYKNQVIEFNVIAYSITNTEKTYVREGGEILISYKQDGLLCRGRINVVTYRDLYEAEISGYGYGESILGDKLVHTLSSATSNSTDLRQEMDGIATNTIVQEILSADGSGTGTLDILEGTNTNWGDITLRFENLSKLKALANLAKTIDYDWWISYGSDGTSDTTPFVETYFNISNVSGADNGVHYYTSGDNQNAISVDYTKDKGNMFNYLVGLGAGDGINQVKRICYAASPVYTTLSANIDADDTTVTVASTSGFSADDQLDIMGEICDIDSIDDGTTFTVTRAASGTACKHPNGCFVSKYVAIGSPPDKDNAEADSSIEQNGLRMGNLSTREYILEDDGVSCQALESDVSANMLAYGLNPIKRIVVTVNEPRTELDQVRVGDTIYITDDEVAIDDSFEVVGYTVGFLGDRGEFMDIEAANRRLSFEELNYQTRQMAEVQSQFMQGSTVMYMVTAHENAQNAKPIDVYFYIPEDAIAINSITLSYRNNSPRTWASTSASGGGSTPTSSSEATHTHSVPAHRHKIFDYDSADTGGTEKRYLCDNDVATQSLYVYLKTGSAEELWSRSATGGVTSATGSAHNHTVTIGTHAHSITYAIKDDHSYTTTDMSIYTTDDASGSPSWTDRTAAIEAIEGTLVASNNGSESNINLASYFTGTGWKGVRLSVDGDSRHWVAIKIKCFTKSK